VTAERNDRLKKRYALEPLVTLRREKVDASARALGEAERQARRETAALDRAREQRAREAARAERERDGERARLEAGLERAQDLTRAEIHRIRERLRLLSLEAEERRAQKKVEAAERVVSDARATLGGARADARTLERQKERFRLASERATHSAEEEAASDFHAVLSRRRKD
jgi:hypothetical protein